MTFIILISGMLLASVSSLPYIRDILRGAARPKLVSWSIWCLLAGVMTLSAFTAGELASGMLSLIGFFGCLIIVALGWRRGDRTISRLDIICLLGAVVGLGSLIVLRDPTIALIVSVVVDAVAFIPTLVHGWTDPDEESLGCFTLASGAALLTMVAALQGAPSIAGLLYPAYGVVFNGAMAGLLLLSRTQSREDYDYSPVE